MTRFAALAPPLLLSTVGLGDVAIGHLLKAMPAICGMPESGNQPCPRSLEGFLRSMRAHQE